MGQYSRKKRIFFRKSYIRGKSILITRKGNINRIIEIQFYLHF